MLANKVAIVTGASRGAGKGVALALGDAGATVYVTGRSSRQVQAAKTTALAAPTKPGIIAPGTIEETAEEVTRRGGRGIPVVCDHTDDAQVAALFDRVVAEHNGQLDLLVNAAWGGNNLEIQTQPFWEMPLQAHWSNMFTAGVRCALIASQRAAGIMVAQGHGLIINVTSWDDDRYIGHLMYDLAKASLNRLAFGMAQELQQHKVAALAVAPGWMRTELVLAAFNCSNTTADIYISTSATSTAIAPKPDTPGLQPDPQHSTAQAGNLQPEQPDALDTSKPHPQAGKHWTEMPDLAVTESPLYLGRAVVALAGDAEGALAAAKEGKVLCVADLARRYGFTDVDGRQPPRFVL